MEIRNEEHERIHKLIFKYIAENLSIRNNKFAEMIFDGFTANDTAFLSSVLEKEHLERLEHLIGKSSKKERGANSKDDLGRGNKIERNIMQYFEQLSSDDSGHAVDGLLCKDLPSELIPAVKNVRETSGLKSFISKIELELKDEAEHVTTVEDKIEEIVESLQKHDVIIVQGNTGCGKTTKIPLAMRKHYNRIVCTEPRQIAAISAANRVANIANCQVGGLVGYRVRFNEKTTSKTRLVYATDGILLNELTCCRNSERVEIYDLIIIDEAHERSLNIDFLLGYLKIKRGFKMIVMSATLNVEKLINYFECPVVTIRHKAFPIKYHYLKKPTECYFEAALKTAAGLVKKHDEGDILVFLTGYEEIEEGVEILQRVLDREKIEICRLYSAISPEEQNRVFVSGKRKIILSTNIAETSVTITTIKFVVDTGKMKQLRQMNHAAINRLEVVTISRSHAKQRGGRAGRIGPGFVYRLYTHEDYEKMAEEGVPDILRLNLHGVILTLKCMGIADPVNFSYIDRPPLSAIFHSITFLYYLKALDGYGRITSVGRMLVTQPLSPEMAMVLLNARCDGTTDVVSTIIAFLSVGNIFSVADGPLKKGIIKKFWHKKGEFYMFLKIYYEWKKHKFSKDFLVKNLLKINMLEQVLKIKAQLMNIHGRNIQMQLLKLADIDSAPISAMLESGAIERAFCAGFFMNIAKLKSKNEYCSIFGDFDCCIHNSDLLYKANPKYVLFYEITKYKKNSMRHCLEIDKNTLFKACNRNIL